MTDLPGPSNGNPDGLPSLPADPSLPSSDPTTVLPVTPGPGAPPAAAVGVPVGAGAVDQYSVVDPPWYRKPGPLAGLAIGALILLGIGGFLLFANDSDDGDDILATTDVSDSVQLDISRITRTEQAVSTSLTATVTGPPARPAEYRWILPAGAQAPQPAIGATDATGSVKFAWAPINAPADDAAWTSTITIDEVLPPNATLDAASFECVLDRGDETSNIIIDAVVSSEPVTESRTVRYAFAAGTEFVPGDSVSCPILSGDPSTETTTTLLPETSTTLPPETSTIPTSTVAPTTLPPTTVAPAPTTPPTAATTTTAAPKTTVISVIEGRTDLSTFANLIGRAGLRDQLAAQNGSFTVVAPNNAAIEALLARADAPDLNDPAAARDFVLAHVKTGEILTQTDLAALTAITFDFGPERVIDATVSPITIGGAKLVETEAPADLGVVHTLERTLVTPAP